MRAMLLLAVLTVVPTGWAEEKTENKPAVDPALHPRVKMETTLGDIILELDAEKAPVTVQNFLQYAQDKYYEGTIFHRVMAGFMIQGGGYTAEMDKKDAGLRPPIKNEWRNGLKNARGTISMARMGGNPDSATSQFFINVVDNAQLDRPQQDGAAYAVFGKVVEGMDVVDKIKDTEVAEHPKLAMGKVAPVTPVIIKAVTLLDGMTLDQVTAAGKKLEEAAAMAKAELAKAFQSVLSDGHDIEGKKLESTASGLMYLVLKEGTGSSPQPTDKVEVHYTGWLMDGTKFDSSVDRGKATKFGLNQVIPGWTEGVGMMKVGEKRKLFIPYQLAYGEAGRPPTIPPKAMLVFDVELLGINN